MRAISLNRGGKKVANPRSSKVFTDPKKAIRGMGFSLKRFNAVAMQPPLGRKGRKRGKEMAVGMVVVTDPSTFRWGWGRGVRFRKEMDAVLNKDRLISQAVKDAESW
jgi:hypothetical protein